MSGGPVSEILQFWGKAQAPEGAAVGWHPAVYHLLDVAATADALLGARPIALTRAARLLRLEPDDARRLLVALIALHDLGKFAPVFQAKSLGHWPAALAGMDPSRVAPSHHTADGYALWEQVLSERLADRLWVGGRRALDVLAMSILMNRPVMVGMDSILGIPRMRGDEPGREVTRHLRRGRSPHARG